MATLEARTQAELDAALAKAKEGDVVACIGNGVFVASGSATVQAWDSATVWASKYVPVQVDRRQPGCLVTVTGGVLIEIPPITTAAEWCEYHGLDVIDGLVTLYKAVDDDYATTNSRRAGIWYRPGTTVEAPDWDPEPECGGGLHFSPRPFMALAFAPDATRYVACPVRLDEVVVHSPADYPDKVKAPRIVGPIVEVDIDGEPVAREATVAA